MPLLKGQPYRPTELLPVGLTRNHEVWVIRTTGEVFLDYELYLRKVRLYHEPVWTCTKTARSGLTYLQAVMSEDGHRGEKVMEEIGPVQKLMPSLQMTLSSAVMPQPLDLELQLVGPYLRNEARSTLSAMTPAEKIEDVLTVDSGNQGSDGKKRRSSGKDADQSKSKGDAKKIPGTVKHTIYETLRCVGANGASISYLHQRLKDCRIQTTWADSSARNCIASLLNHDKAFVKLPKHGHYALASYVEEDEPENEKRELPTNENDVPEFPRNNGRCMKCHKAKHPDNCPLVFCDQCPSAVHTACAKEYESAAKEEAGDEEQGIAFPYLCYKCTQKRKLAERQKVVRQKREEQKQKRQEERELNPDDVQNQDKDAQEIRKRVYPHRPPVARYPIEDLDLTEDDHRHKEQLLHGPILPEPHHQSEVLMDSLAVCEFLSIFGTEMDERLVSQDLTVAELMYCLCWPFDSHILKNTYQALIKSAVHQASKLPDGPSDGRQWNAALDGYTWPEVLKLYLQHQKEHDLMQQVQEGLKGSEQNGEEEKLFLELPPKLHLKLLSTLVSYVSSSMLVRQAADSRLAEAKKLESEINKMKRQMNKVKGKSSTAAPAETGKTGENSDKQSSDSRGRGQRHLRRREAAEENTVLAVENELTALQNRLEHCKIRCDPIGYDRYRNEYFWFASLSECLCIIESDHTAIRCVRNKAQLDGIMSGLNQRGVREKQLMTMLRTEYDTLCHYLGEKEFSFDVEHVPRGVVCIELEAFHKMNKKQSRLSTEKLKEEHQALALKTMVNRLHKIVGSVSSVDSDVQADIKNIRFKINCIASITAMFEFLRDLSGVLRRVFQDGTERQNGKTQMKLTAHLEKLESVAKMSLSEVGFYVATLREIIEPLIRSKYKAQQAAMEAKRKRPDKSNSEKSSSSTDVAAVPSKKAKQKHESSSDDAEETDVLQFVAVPWRVTRSHAQKAIAPPTNLEPWSEASASEETTSEISGSNQVEEEEEEDDDYEVAVQGSGDDEQGSTNEEATCRVCGYGGRLVRCCGTNCEISIHRACIYGYKASEPHWYCSKCARMNRALYRNDRNT